MNYTTHRFQASDMGLAVNAHLVESENGIVIIDATLLDSDSRRLAAKAKEIGKPILAILITHAHPDHVAGLSNLVKDDAPPIFATQAVHDLMKRTEADKHAQWSGMFGEEWIPEWVYPNEIVKDGQRLEFDGIHYTVHDIGGGGDCEANAMWMLENTGVEAFVGDIIYNQNYTYMNDGQILRWMANLERYRSLLERAKGIHIGHGPSGGSEMIDMQLTYLKEYSSTLLDITKGNTELDEESTTEFVGRMQKKYPGYGLEFMLGLSAASVAKELA